jgi:hypothetical protein
MISESYSKNRKLYQVLRLTAEYGGPDLGKGLFGLLFGFAFGFVIDCPS